MQKNKKVGRPKTQYRGVPFPEDWVMFEQKVQCAWKQAIDAVKGPLNEYSKKISQMDNGDEEKIEFCTTLYKVLKTIRYKKKDDSMDGDKEDCFTLEDLEEWKVFDVNRYDKKELQTMVAEFLTNNNLQSLTKRVNDIKLSEKFI